MTVSRTAVGQGATTVARLGLAAVWLVAGFAKVGSPEAMVRSVRAFRLLPEALVQPVGYAVPFLEIALGLLLLAGVATRAMAVVSALLLAVYVGAIASAAARGLRIDCGCFSAGGDLSAGAPTRYTQEILRDGALLVLSVLLARWPAALLSVDRLFERAPAALPAHAVPADHAPADRAPASREMA